MTQCPECDGDVNTTALIEGEIFPCQGCGTELEIVTTAPPSVQLAPKEAEDWGE